MNPGCVVPCIPRSLFDLRQVEREKEKEESQVGGLEMASVFYLVGVDLVESGQDIQDTLLNIRAGQSGAGRVHASKVHGDRDSGGDGGVLGEDRRAVEGSRGTESAEHGCEG